MGPDGLGLNLGNLCTTSALSHVLCLHYDPLLFVSDSVAPEPEPMGPGPSEPGPCHVSNFNFQTDDALNDAVFPALTPIFYRGFKPSDAPIVLRFTGLASFVAFDTIAPYHPTAVGLMTRVPRCPTIEHTIENINIATF